MAGHGSQLEDTEEELQGVMVLVLDTVVLMDLEEHSLLEELRQILKLQLGALVKEDLELEVLMVVPAVVAVTMVAEEHIYQQVVAVLGM